LGVPAPQSESPTLAGLLREVARQEEPGRTGSIGELLDGEGVALGLPGRHPGDRVDRHVTALVRQHEPPRPGRDTGIEALEGAVRAEPELRLPRELQVRSALEMGEAAEQQDVVDGHVADRHHPGAAAALAGPCIGREAPGSARAFQHRVEPGAGAVALEIGIDPLEADALRAVLIHEGQAGVDDAGPIQGADDPRGLQQGARSRGEGCRQARHGRLVERRGRCRCRLGFSWREQGEGAVLRHTRLELEVAELDEARLGRAAKGGPGVDAHDGGGRAGHHDPVGVADLDSVGAQGKRIVEEGERGVVDGHVPTRPEARGKPVCETLGEAGELHGPGAEPDEERQCGDRHDREHDELEHEGAPQRAPPQAAPRPRRRGRLDLCLVCLVLVQESP
jgi:hypothetical protein